MVLLVKRDLKAGVMETGCRRKQRKAFRREDGLVKSHIVYRLCNHMVYTLSLIQPGVIVQEIALFECVNSLVQVDAADSELSEHQCDLPRERRLANGDAFPTKPFA